MEKLITEINNIIKEEYGISQELDSIVSSLIEKIECEVKNSDKTKVGNYTKNNGKITIALNNANINVYWGGYFFNSEQDYFNFMKTHILPNGFIYDINGLMVSIIYVNGKIYNTSLYDTLYHELEHAYQETKMKHEFGSKSLYQYAVSKINSKNYSEKQLSTIIYASSKSEQDAMVNGLYGEIKNTFLKNGIHDIDNIILNSEAIIWLNNLNQALEYVKKNKNNHELIAAVGFFKKNFGYDMKKFLRIGRGSIPIFKRKIGRVIFKAKKDFLNEYDSNFLNNPINHIEENKKYLFYLV